MAIAYPPQKVMYGLWKFESAVSPWQLTEIAALIQKKYPDDTYIFITVVRWTRTKEGVEKYALALYRYYTENEHECRRYIHKMREFFQKKFGRDFHGWDISDEVWIITPEVR